ncbi:MAG: glycosyltransferase family 2 protein [archaeon]
MKFTLVIPVAPERGAEIIESIKKLDYPKSEFHVVVVRGLNPSENRNKGSDRGLGKYIVFLDDDAKIESDYLLRIEDFFNRHPEIEIVGGPQLTPDDDKGFAKISGYALSSLFGAYKLASRYSCSEEDCDVDETSLTSANLICRKDVMDKVRFDPSLFPGEDPKFISDAKKQGYKVAYDPKIRIFHRRRADSRGMLKQFFNYGKVRPAKESFFETLKMPFFFVPSLFTIYLVLLIISILIRPTITGNVVGNVSSIWFWWFVPIVIYILLMMVFSIHDSIKNKDFKAFPLLLPIYPMIHLSYGIGMIWGYFKKLK